MAMVAASTATPMTLSTIKSPPFTTPNHRYGLRLDPPQRRFSIRTSFVNATSSSSSCSSIYGLLLPSINTQHRISMRTPTKQAYICRDCGYIYNERKSFDALTDDFRCPVCYAPKRRFRPYDLPVSKSDNELEVRKARKEKIKNDDAIGNALPVAIVIGLASLVGVYLYLNSQF